MPQKIGSLFSSEKVGHTRHNVTLVIMYRDVQHPAGATLLHFPHQRTDSRLPQTGVGFIWHLNVLGECFIMALMLLEEKVLYSCFSGGDLDWTPSAMSL